MRQKKNKKSYLNIEDINTIEGEVIKQKLGAPAESKKIPHTIQ